MTLRSCVQPDDGHGTTPVSGMSREGSGPSAPSRSSTSRRKGRCSSQSRVRVAGAASAAMLGEVQAEVAHRPDQRVVLVERAVVLERADESAGSYAEPEPRPGDEVGARRDRRGRVELQQRQVPTDLEQVGGPLGVEQLGADRDAARLLVSQLMCLRHTLGGMLTAPRQFVRLRST